MAFKQVVDLDAETTIALGGFNKKTKRDNPTSVEGYYLGARQVESKKSKSGFCAIHYFQTAKGNLAVWGKTDLDRKLANVPAGTMTRASFSKMQPTPNGEMYKYVVELDTDNSIEVGNLNAGSATAGTDQSYSNNGEDLQNEEDGVDEDTQQALALAAIERQAKVQALLKRKAN